MALMIGESLLAPTVRKPFAGWSISNVTRDDVCTLSVFYGRIDYTDLQQIQMKSRLHVDVERYSPGAICCVDMSG
jgi:hypothetical protein